jgi:hypothetical protein
MSATYGKELKFVVFEVKVGNCWLDVPKAEDVAKYLELEFVSYKLINTTMEEIDAERDRMSEQAIRNGCGNDKKREGVVLRPLIEVTKNNGDRIIAKHKNDEFKETKSPRVVGDRLIILAEADKIADEWVTAERVRHVMDKMEGEKDISQTGKFIKLMVEDITREAKDEIFFLVCWLWQEGQAGFRLASEKRTIFSNSLPHSLQWYSYKGITITFLSRAILYPSIAYLC